VDSFLQRASRLLASLRLALFRHPSSTGSSPPQTIAGLSLKNLFSNWMVITFHSASQSRSQITSPWPRFPMHLHPSLPCLDFLFRCSPVSSTCVQRPFFFFQDPC